MDHENGGFYGWITSDLKVDKKADKGGILHARILWTFSKAYLLQKKEEDLQIAKHAYDFICSKFLDARYGGAYWMVDYSGEPVEKKKHLYNQGFFIYGLSEYYKATGDEVAKVNAIELFELMEQYGYDEENRGYFESFTEDWKPEEDLRLSGKDMNEAKSMNTHLHILEAFTNLYRIWKDERLEHRLKDLLDIFIQYIIDPVSYQFKLFFDEQWNSKSPVISYGHDIEGSWLLVEAAEVLNAPYWLEKIKSVSRRMVEVVCREGFDQDGSLLNEAIEQDIVDDDKIWWVQAEGLVGLWNAWKDTENEAYLKQFSKLWSFIKKHQIDEVNGEWFWKLSRDNEPYAEDPKVEPWKCPYHNGRACMELLERI